MKAVRLTGALLLLAIGAVATFVYVSAPQQAPRLASGDSTVFESAGLCGESGDQVVRAGYAVIDTFATMAKLEKRGYIDPVVARALEASSFETLLYADRVDRVCTFHPTTLVVDAG